MTTTFRPRTRGLSFLWLGLGLAALGIAAYAVQLGFRRLAVPWYMPVMAWTGAGLVALSLRERKSAWRGIALASLVLLGGLELTALNAMRLPPYAGPVAVGRPFPAFEAKLADGKTLTQANLAGAGVTAMVFFRGRW